MTGKKTSLTALLAFLFLAGTAATTRNDESWLSGDTKNAVRVSVLVLHHVFFPS